MALGEIFNGIHGKFCLFVGLFLITFEDF